MTESTAELERALLRQPLDLALRERYISALIARAEVEGAVTQIEILAALPGTAAAHLVRAAASLLQLQRRDAAHAMYAKAKLLPGFTPDSQLEALSAAKVLEPVKLTVVPGGRENVIDIERARPTDRIRFDDIAGLEELKRTIRLQIIEPFARPALFAKFKKKAGGGVLLYGPPGCGKTLMARGVAGECRAEFISVGISDILNMYIGESERNLAAIFDKARALRPSVLFFDELDALAFSRSKASSEHSRQVVNEFLSQLDGFSADNQQVLVIAATNMPWDVDSAMKRPGRFTRQVFVPPPDAVARARIVELKLAGVPHEGIDPAAIASMTPHFSGADIESVVETAKEYVLEELIRQGGERPIRQDDLVRATQATRASTLDWLRTARNLVKYAGADDSYADVDDYLKKFKLL
jgi:AAA+ superfamily predicted ATPase